MIIGEDGGLLVAIVHQDLLSLPHGLGRDHSEQESKSRMFPVREDCVGLIPDGAITLVAGAG